MARPSPEFAVTVSVLDRLIDTDPKNSHEVQVTRSQSVRQLKDSLRRDLEWLLNTRKIAFPPDESLQGTQPFRLHLRPAGFYRLQHVLSGGADQAAARHPELGQAFRAPAGQYQVVPIETGAALSRTLRLRIEGLLLIDPAPEHVSFDTVLQLTSGQYEVQNAG